MHKGVWFLIAALALYPELIHAQSGPFVSSTVNGPTYMQNPTTGARINLFPPDVYYSNFSFISPDSIMLGGTSELSGNSVTIRGLPYGPLDTGTLLSLVATDRNLPGTRAGVGPNGSLASATYSNYDEVNLYNQAGSAPPRLSVSSAIPNADGVSRTVSYTANQILFSPSLSPSQVALLRYNMHVLTNSLDGTARSPTVANGRLPHNTYGSQIISWASDGSSITVDGWYVMNSGNTQANQIPPTTAPVTMKGYIAGNLLTVTSGTPPSIGQQLTASAGLIPGTAVMAAGTGANTFTLNFPQPVGSSTAPVSITASFFDTASSNYLVPAVFLGVFTKSFNRNSVCSINITDTPAPNDPLGMVNNQVHECENDESDLWNYSRQDFTNSFHGLTVVYTGMYAVPTVDATGTPIVVNGVAQTHTVLPTSDSYGLSLNNLPNLLVLHGNGSGTENEILGDSVLVKGNAGVPSSTQGALGELFEHSGYATGMNNMRLTDWLKNDTGGAVGYGGTSMHLGLIVDGTQGDPTSGTLQSQLVFDHLPATYNTGNVALLGYNGNGIVVGASAITLTEPLTSATDLTVRNISTTGSVTASGPVYSTSNLQTGPNAPVILRTLDANNASIVGGTLNSDSTGDVVVGTQVVGGRLVSTLPVKLATYTVASLPSCTSALQDTIVAVTDATAPAYRGTLTGGGSVRTPAYCDGSSWTAH